MTDRRPLILAIDDDPGRYLYLGTLLADSAEIRAATCGGCVAALLPVASAVLLDHDLDGDDTCHECGGHAGVANSRGYTNAIADRKLPTIVTSASHGSNRRWLFDALNGRTKVRVHSVIETQPEWAWLGILWSWGVLS